MTHVTDRAVNKAGDSGDGPSGVDDQGGTYHRTVTYADAGVSIHAGEEAVELLKTKVQRTWRPEVVGDIGGFAGLFRLDVHKYKAPLLASSTDGVGTKLLIAQQMDVHDTVGVDLVAMVVDDLVACGAEPLFLLDYTRRRDGGAPRRDASPRVRPVGHRRRCGGVRRGAGPTPGAGR